MTTPLVYDIDPPAAVANAAERFEWRAERGFPVGVDASIRSALEEARPDLLWREIEGERALPGLDLLSAVIGAVRRSEHGDALPVFGMAMLGTPLDTIMQKLVPAGLLPAGDAAVKGASQSAWAARLKAPRGAGGRPRGVARVERRRPVGHGVARPWRLLRRRLVVHPARRGAGEAAHRRP